MNSKIEVNVARYGDEETIITIRYDHATIIDIAEELNSIINTMKAKPEVRIDETGLGAGLVDKLCDMNIEVIGFLPNRKIVA